jgi:GNAT superfamily N-acetyltransferase
MSYLEKMLRSVAPYEPADKTIVRDFQREYFGEDSRQVDDRFAEWLFSRNPHARGASLWVCTRDGVVVGQQGVIPVQLKVDDAEHRAAWLIDLMVRSEWRLKGVAPALFASSTAAVDILLGLGVEDEAYRTIRRGGWNDIGRMTYFARPIDPRACGAGLNAPKLVTQLAPKALFSGTARVAGSLAGSLSRTALDRIESFDERVDAIWADANSDYPVVVKRDFAYVHWRFDDSPQRALYQRYYLVRQGKPVGYAVARLRRWHGHVAASVVDYFAPCKLVAAMLALVFAELARQNAIAVFVDVVHRGLEPALKALGCLRVRESRRLVYKLPDPQSAIATRLGDRTNWLVTPADADYEHIAIAAEAREASDEVMK